MFRLQPCLPHILWGQKGVNQHQISSGKTQTLISLPLCFFSKLRHHCVPICHSPGGIPDSLRVLLFLMENATTVQSLIIKFSIFLSPVCYNRSGRKSGSLSLKCSFTPIYSYLKCIAASGWPAVRIFCLFFLPTFNFLI